MNCHPQTPQSPSQLSSGTDSCIASILQPNLPTPAHSVNGGNSQLDTMDDSAHLKRKRASEDLAEHANKRLQVDISNVGIETLHEDVGTKYLVGKRALAIPKYMPTTDFFETFGLTDLATKLAREKPNGEKNILRKSFKNQLKDLKIEGGYDTKKDSRPADDPNSLPYLLGMPDDYWYANNVKSRELSSSVSQTQQKVVRRACVMARGKVRKEAWDPYVLGSLELSSFLGDSSASGSAGHAAGNGSNRVPRGAGSGMGGGADARLRKQMKKRSYVDSSNEREDAADGLSAVEGDDAKRRKKNAGSMASSSGGIHSGV